MRYVPDRPFPPYAFLPGRDPHPVRDPEGHSYGADEGPGERFDPADWRACTDYLWGVDLYNHGYLWEAHEAWEGLWHASKHDPVQASCLQGLIQCAAACLKVRMGEPRGVARLAEMGTKRLADVAEATGSGTYMGLDLAAFVEAMRAYVATEPQSTEDRPRLALEGLG